MKSTTILSLLLLFSTGAFAQQQIKGSSTLSQTGGPSFLTYDWSAQVSYVKKDNQVYVKISNWNIMVSPNSMYQYRGKQYSRTELGFSQWPCQDNSSGSTQITLTINASGKTFKVSIFDDEGSLASLHEFTNLNFNTYKVTGTSDFWVNGKGCREVEERILANQNQTKKENNSSTSSNTENSNSNSSSSSSSGNTNISNSSASTAVNVPQLMSAEENMRELGIDPNTDYLGNAISMGYSFISDILDERRRKKMQYELEAERARQNMIKIIQIHKEGAESGNVESILILGSSYFYLGDNEAARKWFLIAIDKGSPMGFTGMASIERAELALNRNKYSRSEKEEKLNKEIQFLEKAAESGDKAAFETLVKYYLGLMVGYNDELYSVHIKGPKDPVYDNLYFQYTVMSPLQPWKKLKDLDKAYCWAYKAWEKGFYTPVKIVSNYTTWRNNDTRKIYLKSVDLFKQGRNQEAFELQKKCADRMYVFGLIDLGYNYFFEGSGTPKNHELGFKFTKLAAELGNATAMKNLSIMYSDDITEANGAIVSTPGWQSMKDLKLAEYWKQKAIETGLDYDTWSSETKTTIYNKVYKVLKENKLDDNIAKEIAGCLIEKITTQKTPQQWDNMTEGSRRTYLNEVYEGCTSKYKVNKTPEQEKGVTFGNLGWKTYENGDVDKAIEFSKKSLTFDSTLGYVKANLGLFYLIKDDEMTATTYYVDAISDFKRDKLSAKHSFEAAIDDIKQAIKKYPNMKGYEHIKDLLEAEVKNY